MLSPPALLSEGHSIDQFNCGHAALDDWLRKRARGNQSSGASRTYVVADGDRVVGYYSLASGALDIATAPGSLRRNMPDPIPIAILGRFAVDQKWQGAGLGKALLQDAVLRTMQAADIVGIRGLLVHAISDAARDFYVRHGFVATPKNPQTLVLSLRHSPPAATF